MKSPGFSPVAAMISGVHSSPRLSPTRIVRSVIIALVLFFTTSAATYSQGFTLFSYDHFPSIGRGDAEGPGAGLSFSRLNVGLDFHVPVRQGRAHLINGLRYRHVGLNAGGGSLPFGAPADLQYVQYEMALVQQLSPTWAATVMAAPGLSSDGKGGIT